MKKSSLVSILISSGALFIAISLFVGDVPQTILSVCAMICSICALITSKKGGD